MRLRRGGLSSDRLFHTSLVDCWLSLGAVLIRVAWSWQKPTSNRLGADRSLGLELVLKLVLALVLELVLQLAVKPVLIPELELALCQWPQSAASGAKFAASGVDFAAIGAKLAAICAKLVAENLRKIHG